MNENNNKIFNFKDFWTALVGCFCLFLSIVLSYSFGLKDAYLFDYSNNKVDERNFSKKAYDFNYFNYESNDNIVLVAKNNLVERIIKTDIIIGFNDYNTDNYNIRIMFSNVSISDALTNTSIGSVTQPTFESIKTINWRYFEPISKDLLVNGFSVYFEFFNINNVIAVDCTFYYFNDLLEAVDFETIHYNEFLDLSGYFTPSNFTTYQTFNELKLDGVSFLGDYYLNLGYEARKDSVADSQDKINYIWTILEKGITSVLNVLSFEILPGIPLFVCIAVPILLGLILWVVKMGGS